MRRQYLLIVVLTLLISCKKQKDPVNSPTPNPPSPPAPPPPTVNAPLLKDIIITNLPTPYYHFEYGHDGKPDFVSFASDFNRYDIIYSNGKLAEMRNNIIINKDTLRYSYTAAGKVDTVRYISMFGNHFKRCSFTYTGQQLTKIKWERNNGGGFVVDRTLTLTYHADGNVLEMTDHRPSINGQPELTLIERYDQYDNKINVEGFSLVHDESNDHFMLLPGIQLQKNNPGRMLRTGSGAHYQITYTYTYNNRNAPLTKTGQATILTGPSAGQQFQTSSSMSYYD